MNKNWKRITDDFLMHTSLTHFPFAFYVLFFYFASDGSFQSKFIVFILYFILMAHNKHNHERAQIVRV